jgi:hypothetical protein
MLQRDLLVKHPEARITLGFRKAVYQAIELSKRENRSPLLLGNGAEKPMDRTQD